MSLQAQAIPDIPAETAQVAQAAFPKGSVYMKMRDALGTLYEDSDFAGLYSTVGQPGLSPWRLALVLVMQFAENLTDRQAANAVRGRIDWKYALSLELTDAGFNYSVLSEFRTRLLAQEGGGMALLDKMLAHFKARGLVRAGGRQRTDATRVLAAVHALNRVEIVAQTLQYALDEIARLAPGWLKAQAPQDWFERYSKKLDDYRLPRTKTERERLAQTIGEDGYRLLGWLEREQATSPAELGNLQAVRALRQVWQQQYAYDHTTGVCHWRDRNDLPFSAERIVSPHDVEARFRMKREMEWVGYQVHFTESCDRDLPHVITHVKATVATVGDSAVVGAIHQALAQRNLLPGQQAAYHRRRVRVRGSAVSQPGRVSGRSTMSHSSSNRLAGPRRRRRCLRRFSVQHRLASPNRLASPTRDLSDGQTQSFLATKKAHLS